MNHASVFHSRMEEVRRGELVFDLVTARVVGRHEDLSCELDSIGTG